MLSPHSSILAAGGSRPRGPIQVDRLRRVSGCLGARVLFGSRSARGGVRGSEPRGVLGPSVIELGLFSALHITGLLVAGWWAARPSAGANRRGDLGRVQRAIVKASTTVLLARLPWLLGLGMLGALCIGAFEVGLNGAGGTRWLVVALSQLALGAGLLTGVCQLVFVLFALPPIVSATVDSAESSQDALSTTLARRSGGLVLALECLTTLGGLACFGVGSALTSSDSLPNGELSVAARLLAHYGIGLLLTHALVAQLGAVCVSSVRLIESELVASLPSRHDPKNPAAVIELLALTVGRMLPRLQDSLLTSALMLTVVACSALTGGGGAPSGVMQSLLGLALSLRGFSILSHGFALFAVRGREGESPVAALFRGQAVFVAILSAAGLGCGAWHLDSPWRLPILAVLLGLLVPSAVAFALGSGRPPPRAASTTSRNGQSLEPWLAPVRQLTLGVVTLAASLATLVALSAQFESAAEQRTLLTLMFLVGLSLGLPLFASFGLMHGVIELVRAALLLGQAPITDDGQRRLARLSAGLRSYATATLGTLLGLGALLATLGCLLTPLFTAKLLAVPTELGPLLAPILLATLGVAVVSGLTTHLGLFAGVLRAGRVLAQEVERQCRAALRLGASPGLPRDFVPSYRSCLELFARSLRRAGTGGFGISVGVALLAPSLLPLLLSHRGHATFVAVSLAVSMTSLGWLSVLLAEVASVTSPDPPTRLDASGAEGPSVGDAASPAGAAVSHTFPLPFVALGKLAALMALAVLALSA